MNQDQILRAYSLIVGIKDNIPETFQVSSRWVTEYHEAVNKLETTLDIDLIEFKLKDNDLQRRVTSSNYITSETNYSRDSYCEKNLLLQKISAILAYFTGLQQGKEKQIGFYT